MRNEVRFWRNLGSSKLNAAQWIGLAIFGGCFLFFLVMVLVILWPGSDVPWWQVVIRYAMVIVPVSVIWLVIIIGNRRAAKRR